MARKTRKSAVSAKFGPRYGVKARKRYASVATRVKKKYRCPSCNYRNVKRTSTGIWKCRHCGFTFAGGAYTPITREIGKRKGFKKESDYSELQDLVTAVSIEEQAGGEMEEAELSEQEEKEEE